MNVILTGSLGHIGKPLTEELVRKGYTVTVISSKPEKQKDIEALGATAAIGSIEDVPFLTTTFTGADVVYCMIPPNYFHETDQTTYFSRIGTNYAKAIQQADVKRLIHLSSFGAHLDKGTGMILGAYQVERILNTLSNVAITHMRPTYFYYNLYGFLDRIKTTGTIAANYGGDDTIVLVSPTDIAMAISEEIQAQPTHRKIRYVASDHCTGDEIASILGSAIGKPDLQWHIITDQQMQEGLEAAGIPKETAATLVEMYACLHSGALAEDYYLNQPATLGKVKLTDFAKEFAAVFNQK